jgi:hypothetical protein
MGGTASACFHLYLLGPISRSMAWVTQPGERDSESDPSWKRGSVTRIDPAEVLRGQRREVRDSDGPGPFPFLIHPAGAALASAVPLRRQRDSRFRQRLPHIDPQIKASRREQEKWRRLGENQQKDLVGKGGGGQMETFGKIPDQSPTGVADSREMKPAEGAWAFRPMKETGCRKAFRPGQFPLIVLKMHFCFGLSARRRG